MLKIIIVKHFIYILSIIALGFASCRNQSADATTETEKYEPDTIFVTLAVNNTNRDSLENLYGKFVSPADESLIKQGAHVSASVKLTAPLLPQSWVNDFEGLYSESEEDVLDSLIASYEKQTSVEIALVTIDTSWTAKDQFDNFVLRIHNAWRVGKKDKNNGVVIGICKGYRIIRISNGYGIVAKLTDQETKTIIDKEMIPEFAEEKYFEGTRKGLLRIMEQLR